MTTLSQHIWLAQLMSYDFDIVYRRGSENRAANALSRVSCLEILSLAISSISTELNHQIKESYIDDVGI